MPRGCGRGAPVRPRRPTVPLRRRSVTYHPRVPEDPTVAPLTVGLVLDDSLDRPDGVQQHVLTLGAWLAAQGHHVRYLAPSTRRTDLPHLRPLGSSIQVRYNGNLLSTPRPAGVRRLRAILAEPFDVLNVAMPYSPFMAGRLVARARPTTAVVGTFHILPASRWVAAASRGLGLLQRGHLRRFDRVLAVSAPAATFARTAFGLDCSVVANPVDVGVFARAADAADLDDRVDDAPVHLVFLGRLVERKGPAALLDAVAALHADAGRATPFRVTIAGKGPMAATLARRATELGLGHLVAFPGYVAEEDKAALLASADLVVLPSTGGESFGISVVEALAAARGAVVVGDNPGYRSVMADLTDQLVDPTDTAAFAAVLARFVDDADLRARVRRRQRALAWDYDIERVGPQIVETYRAALATRRPAPA